MLKIKLNAQLPSNLAYIVFLPDLFLLHNLHSANKSSYFVLHKKNLPELPFPHFLSNMEIFFLELS